MTTWTVPARVTRVIDGDTLVADLDLGWSTWRLDQRIRLLGCDAPELTHPEGKAARDFTATLLATGPGMTWIATPYREVTVSSHALDSFGRVLAYVTWREGDQIRNLTAELLRAGHAVPREGK